MMRLDGLLWEELIAYQKFQFAQLILVVICLNYFGSLK